MTQPSNTPSNSRREFLRNSVFASAGVAAAVLTADQAQAASETPAVAEPAPTSLGYQETRHVQDYYRTASF